MNTYDPKLPDILRPTELTDFGDFLGAVGGVRRRLLQTVLALSAPMVARLHVVTMAAASRAASNDPASLKL